MKPPHSNLLRFTILCYLWHYNQTILNRLFVLLVRLLWIPIKTWLISRITHHFVMTTLGPPSFSEKVLVEMSRVGFLTVKKGFWYDTCHKLSKKGSNCQILSKKTKTVLNFFCGNFGIRIDYILIEVYWNFRHKGELFSSLALSLKWYWWTETGLTLVNLLYRTTYCLYYMYV